jgi:hypothetical protein
VGLRGDHGAALADMWVCGVTMVLTPTGG